MTQETFKQLWVVLDPPNRRVSVVNQDDLDLYEPSLKLGPLKEFMDQLPELKSARANHLRATLAKVLQNFCNSILLPKVYESIGDALGPSGYQPRYDSLRQLSLKFTINAEQANYLNADVKDLTLSGSKGLNSRVRHALKNQDIERVWEIIRYWPALQAIPGIGDGGAQVLKSSLEEYPGYTQQFPFIARLINLRLNRPYREYLRFQENQTLKHYLANKPSRKKMVLLKDLYDAQLTERDRNGQFMKSSIRELLYPI